MKKSRIAAGKEKQNRNAEENEGFIISSAVTGERIHTYGRALKEDLIAYTGIDHESGQTLKRSLKDISGYKVNPDYAEQNITQQAGFSAEIKQVANENKKAILNGEKTRTVRTDDIGRVNDPLYDYVKIDENGNPVAGSGVQMKFVKSSPTELLEELTRKKYEKYLNADAKIEVPKDFYPGMQEAAARNLEKLEKQLQYARQKGDLQRQTALQNKIQKIKKLQKNLKPSSLTKAEAVEARLNPKRATFKSMNATAMEAGKESACYAGVVGGSITLIQKGIMVFEGKCSVEEAMKDTAVSIVKNSTMGYASVYLGSMVSGFMQNSSKAILRSLAKTPLPQAVIVPSFLGLINAASEYLQGNISGAECLKRIGKTGITSVSSAAYAAAGQFLIPIPIVGGLVGSMAGIALGSLCYNQLLRAKEEARLAREERIRIEAECEAAIRSIRAYREQFHAIVREYLHDYQSAFDEAFRTIDRALQEGNADGVIQGANQISRKLGGNPEFDTADEFEALMKSDKPLTL